MRHRYIYAFWALCCTLCVVHVALPQQAAAAPTDRCFSATGYCIAGDIRRFWERSGGLATFGYPLTPLQVETVEGQQHQVQWFERYRLELHPQQSWPYSVQLGRLGAAALERTGRAVSPPAGAAAQADCRFFVETGRNLCGDFLRAWSSGGIESDGQRGMSVAESAALFGLPLSDTQPETLSDGQSYLVQWFERARFEFHPELPERSRVLLGLLGAESQPVAQAQPEFDLSQPVRVVAAAVGIDQAIVPTGVDARGAPVVPDHDVGWFDQSAAPGQGENVVLWGHVLRFYEAPDIPAPFGKLKNLRLGNEVVLYDRGGNEHRYVVSRQVWVQPNEVAYILPQGREQVTMVSCIGEQVIQDGEVIDMSHRLITIATPR